MSPDTATKDKAQDKEPRLAPSYLPVRQELPSDSDSEGASATIVSVRKHPLPRTNYRQMIAHYSINTQNGDWNKTQPANGIEVGTSALASMCLADYDLAGSQLRPGTPTSSSQDRMTTNPLSLYASFLGFSGTAC